MCVPPIAFSPAAQARIDELEAGLRAVEKHPLSAPPCFTVRDLARSLLATTNSGKAVRTCPTCGHAATRADPCVCDPFADTPRGITTTEQTPEERADIEARFGPVPSEEG